MLTVAPIIPAVIIEGLPVGGKDLVRIAVGVMVCVCVIAAVGVAVGTA